MLSTKDEWNVILSLCPDAKVLLFTGGGYYVSLPGVEQKENGMLISRTFYEFTVDLAINKMFWYITNPEGTGYICTWIQSMLSIHKYYIR